MRSHFIIKLSLKCSIQYRTIVSCFWIILNLLTNCFLSWIQISLMVFSVCLIIIIIIIIINIIFYLSLDSLWIWRLRSVKFTRSCETLSVTLTNSSMKKTKNKYCRKECLRNTVTWYDCHCDFNFVQLLKPFAICVRLYLE